MAKYLMKYKGRYRIKPHLDLELNDFPRDEHGVIESSYDDIYIKCDKGAEIYHYGGSILVCYVPSIGRGHNILIAIAKELNLIDLDDKGRDYKTLYSILEQDKTIFNITENDEEIEFKFHAKDIDLVANHLKASTYGADISPFSTRNLSKTPYVIPAEDLNEYDKITNHIPKEEVLKIGQCTKSFLRDILSKDKLYRTISIQADMRKKGLKAKQYIHSIGKWDEYLKYLENNL